MKLTHEPKEIIHNRYQITGILGKEGGLANTYSAKDLKTSTKVVLKVTSLHQVSDWKVLELFEREAKVLASLNHPFIPKYLDYFELDTEENRFFYIVQELVPGKSLFELVERGWQYNETTIIEIAKKVLKILEYLHSLTPPIIHRDIKPENLIRKKDENIYLVDFGAVQSLYRNDRSFSNTFVGTLGYMPPEQFSGKVVPSSDLYSLGCTLLFLLTKRSPIELPVNRLKIDFRNKIFISNDLANWLEKILEPVVEDRFFSASEALQCLPTPKNYFSAVQTRIKKIQKKKTIIPQREATNFVYEENNVLFINCLDSGGFYPKSLKIEGEIFILTLQNLNFQYEVSGETAKLFVSTIKKQDGDRNENIYCTIYDGNYSYNFARNLNSKQQEEVVERIANFIENQRDRYRNW